MSAFKLSTTDKGQYPKWVGEITSNQDRQGRGLLFNCMLDGTPKFWDLAQANCNSGESQSYTTANEPSEKDWVQANDNTNQSLLAEKPQAVTRLQAKKNIETLHQQIGNISSIPIASTQTSSSKDTPPNPNWNNQIAKPTLPPIQR